MLVPYAGMQVDLQAVNQSDLRECTSAYNVLQSRGQKENNRYLVKAVPVATALSPFHCRNSLQSPPFPCRGISAPLVLLNTTTALQCPQQQAKMKKMCLKPNSHRAWEVPSCQKQVNGCPAQVHKRDRGKEKGPHAKGRIRSMLNEKGKSLPYTSK